jgi:NAD(P)-dependent dehydrogenase (short-subunit alcohol dehydrogenase family)
MKPGGRIITVTSRSGKLAQWDYDMCLRWKETKTAHDVDNMIKEYLQAVEDDTTLEKGWTPTPYNVSKTALNAAMIAIAKEKRFRKVFISTCCPGFTKVYNHQP